MTLFIWQNVGQVSTSWHPEGGLVVIAETEARARELANSQKGVVLKADECPVVAREISGTEAGVWIFPNAGCC